jgi:heme exporter protein D
MNWGSWDAFLSMGGYGLYVWGSYAVTFALLAAEVASLAARRRGVVRSLVQRGARRQGGKA